MSTADANMASIEERRQIVETRLKEVYDAHESIKEDIELDVDSLGNNYRLLVLHDGLIKTLEKRLERIRNSDNTSSDKPKDNSKPEDDSGPEEKSDSEEKSEPEDDSDSEDDSEPEEKSDSEEKSEPEDDSDSEENSEPEDDSDSKEKSDSEEKSEPEKNSEPEENGEERESNSDAISEAESDNSSEVEIQRTATASPAHQNADQRQKSDGAKKRRRDEFEDLESDQESFFSKTKRSRHHAGGCVSAFDEKDLKLVRFIRRMPQLSTERQIESLKWIHPIGKKMMVEWMDMVESFQIMNITAAKR
ncbi:hypothetical protein CGLO_06973 [Colletotrichum gloeosporioides Cg-14]|uniref:Uncharacterized protein n=1 Tax=Colletotrichum gloeosporioides (strain Cg-14) TaxID=1237896 RepID=T0LXX2_COLGC|nr:hypothetical protein CGLO_06973 [Colletotrichum gloeosporioides Cg-14]